MRPMFGSRSKRAWMLGRTAKPDGCAALGACAKELILSIGRGILERSVAVTVWSAEEDSFCFVGDGRRRGSKGKKDWNALTGRWWVKLAYQHASKYPTLKQNKPIMGWVYLIQTKRKEHWTCFTSYTSNIWEKYISIIYVSQTRDQWMLYFGKGNNGGDDQMDEGAWRSINRSVCAPLGCLTVASSFNQPLPEAWTDPKHQRVTDTTEESCCLWIAFI